MNTNQWELAPLEASWLPAELERSSALLSADLGSGEWERPTASRKETATRLLELLDHGQINIAEGSQSGWLDEKAELPLFDEIGAGTFVNPLDLEEPLPVFSAPESPMFAPSSPAFISIPSSPVKDIKIEEDFVPAPAETDDLFNVIDLISQLEQQENADDYLEIEAAKVADSIMGLIPAASLDQSGSGIVPIDLTALLQSAIEDNTDEDFSASSEENTMVDTFDCSLGFMEDSIDNQTTSTTATPGRRRSARAKAQPYQVPDKLQPAPSGAGIPLEPSNSPAARSGRGRRAKLPLEDRKLRKKEQNKTAATRYRLKKKAETEHLATIEESLEDRNKDLRKQHDDLAHEVAYLKKLMKEIGILA